MTRRRLASESGVTLIELLVAMSISVVIFGLTMTVVVSMVRGADRDRQANEAQDTARIYTDRLARQLRNLASPSIFSDPNDPDAALRQKPEAVDKATGYDFVFRIVNDVRPSSTLNLANVKRVRYCLNTANANDERLYTQEQTWTDRASYNPPAVADTTQCPGTGWTRTSIVVSHLVNRIGGQDRPVFLYNDTDTTRVTDVRSQLYLDVTPNKGAAETRLLSGVTLRNQNRAPVAAGKVTVTGANSVLLNGSDSEDPEGMALKYYWYVDPPTPLPDCTLTPRPASCLTAEGVVVNATLTRNVDHTIVLLVKDPAGLGDSYSYTLPRTP
jgi:prepilin-type N-terminal cleavage/methylation domain-containing protein